MLVRLMAKLATRALAETDVIMMKTILTALTLDAKV